MLSTLISLAIVAVGAAAAPTSTACNENNCLRAIQASAFPTRHGTADCSSYFLTTITPATTTFTATATAFSTTTVPFTYTATVDVLAPRSTTAPLKKRYDPAALVRHRSASLAPRQATIKPSSIPTYASACSGAAGYSSACSCIGATAARTTAPAPSTTVTITRTAIVTASSTTTVATATAQCSSFLLQALGGGDDANGFPINGLYAQVADADDGLGDDVIYFVADPAAASLLALSPAGALSTTDGYIANSDAGPAEFLLYFNTQAEIDAYGYAPATCSVTPASTLQCVDGSQTMFEICLGLVDAGGGVVFSSEADPECVPIAFKVVPSC
ncbi:hypothetical protein MMC17_010129 [Xylographa soralifera]|nr:hypothetical protein [Xylographa soralifera]